MSSAKMKSAPMPRVRLLSSLSSRVHFCREAVLVRLTGGRNRITNPVTGFSDSYQLCLDDDLLVKASIPRCGTCSGRLWHGYGEGLLPLEECMAVRDSVNEPYTDLVNAIENIAPFLGLFSSGLYMVADFDLFPVQKYNDRDYEFFWDAPLYRDRIQAHRAYVGASYYGSDYHDAPLYLYPTQSPCHMDLDTVAAYEKKLEEGDRFPRAIAYYLNGSVSLLLDGHHKAAAAASAGVPVKCLVIFRIQDTKELKQAHSDDQRLYLRHGKNVGGIFPMAIENGQGEILSRVMDWTDQEKNGSCPTTDEESTEVKWGKLPISYQAHPQSYPIDDLLVSGTLIPPDRLQQCYHEMRKNLIFHNTEDARRIGDLLSALLAYDRLFPEGKGLTEPQRQWLREDAVKLAKKL